MKNQKQYSLKEFCQELSISTATARNWMKLQKIVPTKEIDGKPYFSKAYTQNILESVRDKNNTMLKSRRNKKYISGSSMYKSYLPTASRNLPMVKRITEHLGNGSVSDMLLCEILAECALQLLCQAKEKRYDYDDNFLMHFLQGELELGEQEALIMDLLEDAGQSQDIEKNGAQRESNVHNTSGKAVKNGAQRESNVHNTSGKAVKSGKAEELLEDLCINLRKYPQVFQVNYILEKNADVLGMLYMSLKNMGVRKAAGSYYTPVHIVKKLTNNLLEAYCEEEKQTITILDPCCGTGNFLLQLPEGLGMEQIYGRDIDKLSIKLARINMALKFKDASVLQIKEQIKTENFLQNSAHKKENFDCIIGNPPWGFHFSNLQKKELKKYFQCAQSNQAESCDVFLEQALRQVKSGGRVAFVLPEAVLHVKSHMPIRKIMMEHVQIEALDYLGNVFDKVQCPAVILQMKKTDTAMDTRNMRVSYGKECFQVGISRKIEAGNFYFHMTDAQYEILQKMEQAVSVTYLGGQADFALGIVTGDNKSYISHEKKQGQEVVLKGADLCRYGIGKPKRYLTFEPEHFQQTAPEAYYRAPEKLLYRFIGKELIVAYDNNQRLSLNSCNILIPHVEQMEMKYILAVLNSRMAQFVFEKKFRSLKVLRSHLEQIPIPCAGRQEQREIVLLADKLIEAQTRQLISEEKEQILQQEEVREYYEKIDRRIAALFSLTEEEYDMVRDSILEIRLCR